MIPHRSTPAWILAAVSVLALALPSGAEAQVDLGVQGVYNTEQQDGTPGVGARAAIGVPATGLGVHADFNWLFPDCPADSCESWELLGGVRYGILPASPASPYVGAGFAFQNLSVGPQDTDDTGFNVLAGLELGGLTPVQAYGEVSYRLMDAFEDQLVLSVGLQF